MREAIVSLSDAELERIGFGELVTHCREAGISDVELLEDDGDTCVPQVEVETPLDADVLAELDCVDGWEHVAERGDTHLYVLKLTATDLPEATAEDHEELVGSCEASLRERGVFLSLVGSQEAIRKMLRNYEDAGVHPDLHKLGTYEGDEAPFDGLTERQREAIQTAYEMGFYDVPREATTEDVATELDVNAATLSEHLQRAERNLLSQQLSP